MSRGITKPQMAIAIQKGKILEVKLLQERMRVGNSISLILQDRLKELEEELKVIEGNVIAYKDMQQKGLIS